MEALFIGQAYIDVTFLTDHIPTGDEKGVASAYAISFGGNAVTAAFCCAKLGIKPDLISSHADDWLGRMFLEMAEKYNIHLHTRAVAKSSLSFVMPNKGKRAIVRCRDDQYLEPFPKLEINGCRALHVDGHQHDAALYYARKCRAAGVLTSLDGGAVRGNTDELLAHIDVAIVAERFCEQLGLSSEATIAYLKARGCRVAGVTLGEQGLIWMNERGAISVLPALELDRKAIIDTSGAGDVFHGAYIFSYLTNPDATWLDHFRFARAASAFKVQHLGNEAGLPTLRDIRAMDPGLTAASPSLTS